jgi:hypothetical protein
LVIFDLLRQSSVAPSLTASFCARSAQCLTDVRIHAETALRDFR